MLLDAFLFFIYAPKMLFYNSIFSVLNYLFFGSYKAQVLQNYLIFSSF